MISRSDLNEKERQFVLVQRVARLATADEEGHPHVVPVCFAFDGTHFYTPLDEKPKRVSGKQLRRVRNIEARHEAMLLFDHYEEDWSKLGFVQVFGRAGLIHPGEEEHEAAIGLLRERYEQYRAMKLEISPVIRITPERIVLWGAALEND
ncbi:MAG TPA: TIGR03668 family PPOX class F420-dependent oxidoreductase [Ktedonobacteraceae bacterium]|jgi:PPOX class probable F420-dependent enzyme|nr:TIGR03668 family PPOX class F420-dependent oxidoreductase [Ktedonobacteraceae bacterium]